MGHASSPSRCRLASHAAIIVLLVLTTSAIPVLASNCNSCVLQMKPIPADIAECYSGPSPWQWSIKTLCSIALRVRVMHGIVKIVPLQLGSYDFVNNIYVPAPLLKRPGLFHCKDLNASGLFNPGSTTAASVMLYDDFGWPLSNLTKTGPTQISLAPGRKYCYDAGVNCDAATTAFNYTVTEGCVFGIRARAKPVAACSAGYYRVTGRFNNSYCMPCAPGTFASKPGAACRPCPRGWYASYYGASSCRKCPPGAYAATQGSSACVYCNAPYDTYGNAWTDGIRPCANCPSGSFAAPEIRPRSIWCGRCRGGPQCFKCVAGRKCCTVGWSKDCPKCADGTVGKNVSSIFALESATPPLCLASSHALCAPKINITVDSSCAITINSMAIYNVPDVYSCSWRTTLTAPVHGTRFSTADLAKLDGADNSVSLLFRNFTGASSPYLTFYIPATHCTLRYRALTSPVATLLGAAPKPGTATTCPAGQYLETATDAQPGPCLPCPPGTYSSAPSSGSTCSRCPAGTYTDHYGSIECKACPADRVSAAGAASCKPCAWKLVPANARTCVACPTGSGWFYPGARCLVNAAGNVCCAAGDCAGQVPCEVPLPSGGSGGTYTAIFQVVSQTLPQPACRNATFLNCLPPNAKLLLRTSLYPLEIFVDMYKMNLTCRDYNSGYSSGVVQGGYTGTNSAYLTPGDDRVPGQTAYGMVSNSSTGTVRMYSSPNMTNSSGMGNGGKAPAAETPECSVTLKLLRGYAFDLTPPPGAACDPLSDLVTVYQGRKFCSLCYPRQSVNSKGRCQGCAPRYYMEGWSGVCKPCPAGYQCDGSFRKPCNEWTYSSKPKQAACSKCPANTHGDATNFGPHTKCNPCPKGTIAPVGALQCGVPWDMSFPA